MKALASLKLTPREAEVLFWISQGKSNYDIGVILGAKTGTICKHVEHIFGKLNVENRTAAAVVALETFRSAALVPESKPGQAWADHRFYNDAALCVVVGSSRTLRRNRASGRVSRIVCRAHLHFTLSTSCFGTSEALAG
jgi:DNA-binding CsgD family transcriptional regulator